MTAGRGIDEDEAEKFDSQTVSGWVIEQTGDIPKKFQSFDYNNLTIIVNRLTQRKILDVKVKINPPEEETSDKDKDKAE